MVAMVKNFGGWVTQKKWELRAGEAELRLDLERKRVSWDLWGTLETPRHFSSHTGTSRSHPLVDLTQPERNRTTTRISPTSSRRNSVILGLHSWPLNQ